MKYGHHAVAHHAADIKTQIMTTRSVVLMGTYASLITGHGMETLAADTKVQQSPQPCLTKSPT
jgi:hypothetical protein